MNQVALQTGATLHNGIYRIDKTLGQGGFGITYLATDLSLDRPVAIKEFFPKTFCDRDTTTSHVTLGTQSTRELVEKLKAKFLKEAKNIAKFNHPNIIKIYAAFEENNTAYYVMEFIEGESLSERVKRQGALSHEVALDYIGKIGDALDYVHSFHMNHLDVKPANIVVRKADDCPILIDFGLSKQYDKSGNQTSTTPVGISHGFAPFEQYHDGGVREFSPTTDEYSLAATLYYLLSSVTPPQAPDLIENKLSFPASIPTDMIAPITKAMSQARKMRYPTVREFVSAINGTTVTEETEILVKPKSVTKPTPSDAQKTDPDKKPFSWIKWLAITAVVVVAVLIWRPWGTPDTGKDKIPVAETEEKAMQTTGTINGHEWVDLGLSVKWATCNVGASSPSDYGNYYAWGETTTKSEYTEENCKTYGKDISDISGNPDYDAARANWGSTWRMPTKAEFEELIEKCTWKWVTYDGHTGYKVTSKTNGKSIFFPAAGWRSDSSLGDVGENGYYWGSTPDESDASNAYDLYFDSSNHGTGWSYRDVGRTVRPVSE